MKTVITASAGKRLAAEQFSLLYKNLLDSGIVVYIINRMTFRWIDWNLEHATKHGCVIVEIEAVIENARAPYPMRRDSDKWLVIGAGTGGRMIQAMFLIDNDGTIFVIHARPITDTEKRRERRRKRRRGR